MVSQGRFSTLSSSASFSLSSWIGLLFVEIWLWIPGESFCAILLSTLSQRSLNCCFWRTKVWELHLAGKYSSNIFIQDGKDQPLCLLLITLPSKRLSTSTFESSNADQPANSSTWAVFMKICHQTGFPPDLKKVSSINKWVAEPDLVLTWLAGWHWRSFLWVSGGGLGLRLAPELTFLSCYKTKKKNKIDSSQGQCTNKAPGLQHKDLLSAWPGWWEGSPRTPTTPSLSFPSSIKCSAPLLDLATSLKILKYHLRRKELQ